MGWLEDLEAALPPPHRDDPGSVRRDILDEIADHLQSSVERELTTGADADEARRRALHRFGDPQQIAGQLFLEAVKEKAMSQRLTLVLVVLLCMISLAGTYLLWRAVQQGQETTAAIVARLDKMAKQPATIPVAQQPPDYMEWIPVTVKLVDDEGKPVANPDYKVNLSGNIIKDGESAFIKSAPDAHGVCDFGLIRPGKIEFRIYSPWGEQAESNSLVRPGKPFDVKLTVPSHERNLVEQKIVVEWPEDLANKPLWTHLVLAYNNRETGGMDWRQNSRELRTTYYADQYSHVPVENLTSPAFRDHDTLPNGVSILISPQGKIVTGELDPEQLTVEIPSVFLPERNAYQTPKDYKLYSSGFSEFWKSDLWRINHASTAARWYLSEFPRVHFRRQSSSENSPNRTTAPLPRDGVQLIAVSIVLGNAANLADDVSLEMPLGTVELFRKVKYQIGDGRPEQFSLSPAEFQQIFSWDADNQVWRFALADQQLENLRNNIALVKELLAAANESDQGDSDGNTETK